MRILVPWRMIMNNTKLDDFAKIVKEVEKIADLLSDPVYREHAFKVVLDVALRDYLMSSNSSCCQE